MDWKCQLKLSILIGLVASLGMHTAMDHLIQFPIDWHFDVIIFVGATAAWFGAMRARIIRCPPTDNKHCQMCQGRDQSIVR